MSTDGGARPELYFPQYPINMGRPDQQAPKSLTLRTNDSQQLDLNQIIVNDENKIVYSSYLNLLPKQIHEDDPNLLKPSDDELETNTLRTKQALEALVSSKVTVATPLEYVNKQQPTQYIRYTPSQQGPHLNSGAKQRIIQMVEVQKDPMEPPRFKINEKLPRGPPSPSVPILHSPTRQATIKQQPDWKIPPCISNWKNSKGYTIPLDKRLAADGRGLQNTHINENFATLARSLYTADLKAREAVETRTRIENQMAKKEKERKEERLRELAVHARTNRAGISTTGEDDDERFERDQIRQERQKERQRAAAFQRAGGEKRKRPRERDVSEQIALVVQSAGDTGVQYDQRLFNMSAGFHGGLGDEDAYNVYDGPWNSSTAVAAQIYKPSKTAQHDLDDAEALINASKRFRSHHEFKGAEPGEIREDPVQFEHDQDPFGLSDFLKNVRHGDSSTSSNPRSKNNHPDDEKKSKRRKK